MLMHHKNSISTVRFKHFKAERHVLNFGIQGIFKTPKSIFLNFHTL